MAYPSGIQTVTLRLGSTFDSAGTLAKITGEVVPMWGPGADHLVWADTGQTYAKVSTPLAWDDTEKVAYATVPHPTQAGWRDQTQATFTGWSYRITAMAVFAGGQRQSFERTVTPLPGDTVIDVDLLPNGAAATPTVVAEWEAARADALAALAATEVEQVTLTDSLAYTLPAGVAPNRTHSVVFTQDATGGHTVTFGGQPVSVDTAAGAATVVEFWPGGKIVYPGASTGPVDLSDDIVAWGDSLTAGGWPATTAAGIAGGGVVRNSGVGGDSAGTIAARQGGLPVTLLPVGGTIPASGPVTVTVDGPWQSQEHPFLFVGDGIPDGDYAGTVAGVYGTLTYSGGVYTFTRTLAGVAVPVSTPAPFVTNYSIRRRGDIAIIWAGRNSTSDQAGTLAAIRAMADHLTGTRYLVLGVTKGRTEYAGTGTASGNNAVAIDAINAALAAEYGSRYVDIGAWLTSSALAETGTRQTSSDTLDIAGGAVPSSLRIDLIHLTTAGYVAVGNFIGTKLAELGWVEGYTRQTYPAPPPAINDVTVNGQAQMDKSGYEGQNGATTTRDTSQAYAGAASIRVEATTHADSRVLIFNGGATRFNAPAGATYRVRCRVKSTAGKALRLVAFAYDALSGGTSLSSTTLATITTTGGWDLIYAEYTPPAGAVGLVMAVHKEPPSTDEAFTFYLDAVEFGLPA